MKSLIVTLSAVCAVVAGYLGVRYFTRKDLRLTPVKNYVRKLAKKLLHTKVTAPKEAGAIPQATAEPAM